MKRLPHREPVGGVSPGDGPDVLIFARAVPVGGLVLAVALEGIFPLAQSVAWLPTAARGFFAVVFFLAGLLLFAGGHVSLGRAGTNVDYRLPALSLVETWPYSWSRNPIYLGVHIMWVGVGLAFRLYWMLLLLPVLHAVCHYGVVLREEHYLAQKFGLTYQNYQARVRRWI